MSKYVADLYERRTIVPVGQVALTNNLKKLPEGVHLELGQPLTGLELAQFDVFGQTRESTTASMTEDGRGVLFSSPKDSSDRLVVDASFDSDEGRLTIVRKNGEEVPIESFLTKSDFGLGPPGPKGPRGKKGFNGFDSDQGPCGVDGCAGDNGSQGQQGLMGDPGPDGPQGIEGPQGEPGPNGLPGPDGKIGRLGNEGCRGTEGCPGTVAGSNAGPATNTTLFATVGSSAPATGLLWGYL